LEGWENYESEKMKIEITLDKLKKYSIFVAAPMYGGNCSGLFCKSTNDLAAMCARYDITLKFYYLFNESVISRARNYCVDEFLRSDCTHLMFIDSDIGFNPKDVLSLLGIQVTYPDQYDIMTAPYPKKCLHSSNKILTEDGYKTINDIVTNKYSGKVASYAENGQFQWNNIISYSKEKNYGKEWVSLRSSGVRSRNLITVTKDHEVSYVRDVLNPSLTYEQAEHIVGKYIAVRPTKNSNRRYNALWNKDQISVALGTALSDGCLSGGRLTLCHGVKQKEYLKHKCDVLGININIENNTASIKNAQTIELSKLIGSSKDKTIRNVIDRIDLRALSYMFMDDGHLYDYARKAEDFEDVINWYFNTNTKETCRSLTKPAGEEWIIGRKETLRSPTCSLATTMNMGIEDTELLIKYIEKEFNIVGQIRYLNPGKYGQRYPFINFDQENTKLLMSSIAPFVHPSMSYKVINYNSNEYISPNTNSLDYGAIKIDHISKDVDNSYLYDIGVENAHSMVANDCVVHNCISWEKVKKAVEIGKAENPFDLMHYAADYVFNPVANAKSFRIDQPVEVSEAGTGFMLIPRSVFDRYKEAYPELSYKPDHIRTESFDGTREIMAYFDCAIDPETKRYLSEDYFFCWNARKIDIKVHMCPWMQLQHVGSYIFRGSMSALAGLDVSPTATKESNQKLYKKKNKTGIRP